MSTWPMRWPKEKLPCVVLDSGRIMWCLDLGLQQRHGWLIEDGPNGKTQSFWRKALPQDFLLARGWITAQGLSHFTDVCWSRKPQDAVGRPERETLRLLETSGDEILLIYVVVWLNPGREFTGCQWEYFIFKTSPVTIPEGIFKRNLTKWCPQFI